MPEMTLGAGFCLAIVADLVARGNRNVAPGITMLTLVLTAFFLTRPEAGGTNSIWSGMYAVDGFALFFKGVIVLTAMFVTIFSTHFEELNRKRRAVGEYYAMILAGTLGMILMTGANNLLMMYLALEMSSISSYILTGYTRDAKDSSEASLKYVLFGAVSSGLMLYGMSILYGMTGTLDLYGISRALMPGDLSAVVLIVAGVLIIVGFGYKISAVPFHFWTPDVYEGAPITVTAFLAVASKAGGFAMLIRFFKVVFLDSTYGTMNLGSSFALQSFQWNDVLAIVSVLTMTLGNLVAIWQQNLKRLLAYSSIAHAGYMLLGIVVLGNAGMVAIMVYFVVYLFMNLGAFYVVMLIANKTGSEEIDDYRGIGKRAPILGVAMTIFMVSLTGLPPTAGFIGKLYLFAAVMNAHWFWIAIIAALNSVVSLYYYVRVFRNMYLREPEGETGQLEFPAYQLAILLILLIPTLLLGVYFGPLVELAQSSVTMFSMH